MVNNQPSTPSQPVPTKSPIEQKPGFGGFADKPGPDPDVQDTGKD